MFKVFSLLPFLLVSSPAMAQENDQNLLGSWNWSHDVEGLTATLSFAPDSLELEIVFEVNDPHVWKNYVEGIGDTVDVSEVEPISSLSLYSSSPYTTENGMISTQFTDYQVLLNGINAGEFIADVAHQLGYGEDFIQIFTEIYVDFFEVEIDNTPVAYKVSGNQLEMDGFLLGKDTAPAGKPVVFSRIPTAVSHLSWGEIKENFLGR